MWSHCYNKNKDPNMRALVTGGAKRLGRAMALYLANRGYDVAIHYNGSAQAAQDTVAEIQALGRVAVAVQADILDEAQVTPLIAQAVDALGGPLNVLINNASVFEYDNLDTASRQSWDRHMESNLRVRCPRVQSTAAMNPLPAD